MADNRMNAMDVVALVLVIVGALNWGLIGLFNFNAVEALLGFNVVTRIIYVLVGLAGLWTIWTAVKAGQEARTTHPRGGGARRV